ncbi:MAG: hypothetical protein V1712_02420, partial [Patescibacteria group bacterium]
LLIILLAWLVEKNGPLMTWLKSITALALVLVIPAAFLFFSQVTTSGASVQISGNILKSLPILGQQMLSALPILPAYIDLLDLLYLGAGFLSLAFLFLAGWGLYKANLFNPRLKLFAYCFALLTASYLLMKLFFIFPYLAANEQNFYTQRVWELSLLFLWPLVMIGIYDLWQRFWNKGESIRLVMIIIVIFGLTSAWYLTYPRHDLYHKDTGYNTTSVDIEAVKLINNDAQGQAYLVLANQAVSAAALSEFGFAHYYAGHLYYPLPTGINPLYQIFLEAVEQQTPQRDIIKQAYEITGVSRVYLVINQYWADFDELTNIARGEANQELIENNQTAIFRYDFK